VNFRTRTLLQKIVVVLLFGLSLHANDLLTNYRINGIQNIEKQMDLELTRVSYWHEYLKDKDIKFGYIENYSSVLTCNKEKSVLSLYQQNQKNNFEFQKNYAAFTGKEKGDKKKEGDLRTPIGIYGIVEKISKLDSFYGPLAFVTSYPNLYDAYKGKNGSGIWIHGLPTEQERDEYTKGCIAINNAQIECLEKRIDIQKTLLIIHEAETPKETSKETLANILTQLYQWRYSWLYNDIEGYLKFYSSDFIRNDGMKYEDFKRYKTRVFTKDEKKIIILTNINVLPYPGGDNIYQITFKELYESNSYKFTGDKTLMIQLEKNKIMKIFTEQ